MCLVLRERKDHGQITPPSGREIQRDSHDSHTGRSLKVSVYKASMKCTRCGPYHTRYGTRYTRTHNLGSEKRHKLGVMKDLEDQNNMGPSSSALAPLVLSWIEEDCLRKQDLAYPCCIDHHSVIIDPLWGDFWPA